MIRQQQIQILDTRKILIGNRVPRDFFITSGAGESDITIHAGSYHLALKEAGIERCNIMTYSSILPGTAKRIDKTNELIQGMVHGAVMETIMATANSTKGKRATAGIVFGWLFNKRTGEKYGGLVCEYNGSLTEEKATASLKASLNELYTNGFSDEFELKDVEVHMKSFVPKKKYGTALVSLCFTNYDVPVLSSY